MTAQPAFPQEHALFDPERAPKHVSIIMDGNRRWARHRGLPTLAGHAEGLDALMRTVEGAADLGVEVLTVFGFSTENWNRTAEEVDYTLQLMGTALDRFEHKMVEEGVRLSTIGDMSRFPKALVDRFDQVKEATAGGKSVELVLALSYGGRDDIRRAVSSYIQDVLDGKASQELTEERLASYLDTARWPDPELVVRTSGEMRLSNFLLWQTSYSELIVTETLWPDFGPDHLRRAIIEYQRRQRRLGN